MRKLLLSQSQVSVVVSSAVVLFFTILLFFSGYIIQQRTLKGLQVAIRPRIPQSPPSLNEPTQHEAQLQSRVFGRKAGHVTYTNFDRDVHGATINWQRLAHIQLVRRHHDVCSAIMVLAELHWAKSPARRVLLFPKTWAEEKKAGRGDLFDPYLDSTRRLMRLAARRYKVELRPINPIGEGVEGEELYSLASAFALEGDFDRVLTIETPGLVLDAEPLDAILGFTEDVPFAMLHDTAKNDGVHSEDLYLLQPNQTTFDNLETHISSQQVKSMQNDKAFSALFPDAVLLASSNENIALIRSIGVLHDVGNSFNQTAYLSDVAYVRFSDPKLPGPEYEVPWSQKLAARPRNKDADWVWTKMYGEFAQKRMDICGLDLESWRA